MDIGEAIIKEVGCEEATFDGDPGYVLLVDANNKVLSKMYRGAEGQFKGECIVNGLVEDILIWVEGRWFSTKEQVRPFEREQVVFTGDIIEFTSFTVDGQLF